jgi:hypothetical protein
MPTRTAPAPSAWILFIIHQVLDGSGPALTPGPSQVLQPPVLNNTSAFHCTRASGAAPVLPIEIERGASAVPAASGCWCGGRCLQGIRLNWA